MSEKIIFEASFSSGGTVNADFETEQTVNPDYGEVIDTGGTSNYEKLAHKPSINGVELAGNKSLENLGVIELTNLEIEAIIRNVFD